MDKNDPGQYTIGLMYIKDPYEFRIELLIWDIVIEWG